ncbi:MAG: hypothetical protein HYZ23_02105 [Chloroflexi bacterium]|nr:hypothetical protein [Chloroflexota bacterium]
MGDYNRSTRETTIANLPSETTDALNKHIERYELGSILDDALICVEANSEKIKKGLFSGPGAKVVKSVIILTPRWLLEVVKADNDAAFARSAQLTDITISDYEKSPFYAKIPDTGVQVSGRYTDTSESSTSFIGLGKDAAGEKFKSMLIEAVQDAKK